MDVIWPVETSFLVVKCSIRAAVQPMDNDKTRMVLFTRWTPSNERKWLTRLSHAVVHEEKSNLLYGNSQAGL